jgi:hypothetical protein
MASLVSVGAASAAPSTLPNACTVLKTADPQAAFGSGLSLAAQTKLVKYGSGKFASETCTEAVGSQRVVLSLTQNGTGGFGGVSITSTTHPSGLGSGADLIVGTASGSGTAVDFVTFHRGSIYADLSANGASPTKLAAFAKKIYKLL